MDNPIIGRKKELSQFEADLSYIQANPDAATQRQLIVFEGDSGIGKTRMLDAIIAKALIHRMK